MTYMLHVHSYLVCSACLQRKLKICVLTVTAQHPVMCYRRLYPNGIGSRRTFLSVGYTSPERNIDRSAIILDNAGNDRPVLADKRVLLYLLCKAHMRRVVLCYYKQTRRVFIESVHYPRTHLAVYGRKSAAAFIKQRIHESAVRISRCRMDDHSLRLIYHQKVIVLVHDLHIDILRHRLYRARIGNRHGIHIALFYPMVLRHRSSVD